MNARNRYTAFGAISIFLGFAFLKGFVPIYPVYMIMFAGRGFDYMALSLLLAIWSIPVVVLELPSGILADRWSKKGVVIIGMVLKGLCFLIWGLSPSFAAAAIGFVLWGCQEAFCSGATQALLYEAVKRSGLQERYATAAGVSTAMETAAIVVSMAAGGAIYAWSPGLCLGISAATSLAAAALALGFHGNRGLEASAIKANAALENVASEDGAPKNPDGGWRGYFIALRTSLGGAGLPALIAAACVATAAYGTIDEFDGLWAIERFGVPMAWVGVWGAVRFSGDGIGALLAGKISPLVGGGNGQRMAVALAAAGLGLTLSVSLPGLWGAPVYLAFYFIMAALAVVFETRLQEQAADSSRAGLLSLSSLLMTLCAIGLSPVLGMAGDAGGLAWIVRVCGLLTALSAAAFIGRPRRSS